MVCKDIAGLPTQAEKHSFRPVTSISRTYHPHAIEPVRQFRQSHVLMNPVPHFGQKQRIPESASGGFNMKGLPLALVGFCGHWAFPLLLVAIACSVLQVACGASGAISNNNGSGSGHSACSPASSTYAGTQPVTYSFSILHNFTGHAITGAPDGGHPYAGLLMDGAGN